MSRPSEMGIDRVEFRRRNIIRRKPIRIRRRCSSQYDSGDPMGCLDRRAGGGRLSRLSRSARRRRSATASSAASAISTYVEACGLAPSRFAGRLGARGGLYESATVRVHPTGQVTVLIGTHNHGQGHETTFAQIVSEKLGVAVR